MRDARWTLSRSREQAIAIAAQTPDPFVENGDPRWAAAATVRFRPSDRLSGFLAGLVAGPLLRPRLAPR